MNLLSKLLLVTARALIVVGVVALPIGAPVQAQDAQEFAQSQAKKSLFGGNKNSYHSSTAVETEANQKLRAQAGGQQDKAVHQFHNVKPWNPGNGWTAWPRSGLNFANQTIKLKPVATHQAPQQTVGVSPQSFERPQEAWAYQNNYTNQSSTAASATGTATETDAYGSVVKKK